MIPLLIERFALNLDYARGLLDGVDEPSMIAQPRAGMGHPAWIIGHLAWAADKIPILVRKGSPQLGDDWAGLFSNTSRIRTESGLYPEKTRLIEALEGAHERAVDALHRADADRFSNPFPDPTMRSIMPTIGSAVVHLTTTHEAAHLGQLSAWRRAMGLPPFPGLMFV